MCLNKKNLNDDNNKHKNPKKRKNRYKKKEVTVKNLYNPDKYRNPFQIEKR